MLGIVGVTALVAPILVSCGENSGPVKPKPEYPVGPQIGDISARSVNHISFWEVNQITNDKISVEILNKAFFGVTQENFSKIKMLELSKDGVFKLEITLDDNTTDTLLSLKMTDNSTILTKKLTDSFFGKGGIWFGKKQISSKVGDKELDGTTEIGEKAFMYRLDQNEIWIPNTVKKIGNLLLINAR